MKRKTELRVVEIFQSGNSLMMHCYFSFIHLYLFLYADEEEATSTKDRKDLSEWQEGHAILILSRVKV